MTASERVNPDENDAPLPTVVRVLQLTRAARVEQADFTQLWEELEATLGDDLVEKQELTVFPGTRSVVAMELEPKTRFLAGMAVFRQPTGSQWRTIVPLPASERLCAAYKEAAPEPAVDISLDGYRIEAHSHLLRTSEGVDLPADVTAGAEKTPDTSRAPDTNHVPPTPAQPQPPRAPTPPSTPSGM